MTYDTTQDVLINALRSIALTEVNAALSVAFGGPQYPAIKETRGMPLPIEIIERTATPLLMIFVERETSMQTSTKNLDSKCNIVFEYLGPLTPLPKLDARWPMLRPIWRSLLKAVSVGKSANVEVLKLAGVQETHEDEATVDYRFAEAGDSAYPFFSGKIPMTVRPSAIDWDALPDFTTLGVDINRTDGNIELQPQVQLLLNRSEVTPDKLPDLSVWMDETLITSAFEKVSDWASRIDDWIFSFGQVYGSRQPVTDSIGGLPAVGFRPSLTSILYDSETKWSLTPLAFDLSIVVRIDSVAASDADPANAKDNDGIFSDSNGMVGISLRQAAGEYFVQAFANDGSPRVCEVQIPSLGAYLIQFWHSGTSIHLNVWGVGTDSKACGAITTLEGYAYLGANHTYNAGFFDGAIGALVCTRSTLPGHLRAGLGDYLSRKSGV